MRKADTLDEDLVQRTLRLPSAWWLAIDRRAKREGLNRTEFLRSEIYKRIVLGTGDRARA